MPEKLHPLQTEVVQCRLCPRLVEYRESVARQKRRAFRDWEYWGKPVPSLGTPKARLLILGLAPAAHGANRTGRMFTGDRSGDFLFETLHRFGFCNQPHSGNQEDGLELLDAYITAAIHCVPPGNKPTAEEIGHCNGYLRRELRLLTQLRVVVVLGRIAWKTFLDTRQALGWSVSRPRPKFEHGASYRLDAMSTLITSYHPSQQNTQTGRLTKRMFDVIFRQARQTIDE